MSDVKGLGGIFDAYEYAIKLLVATCIVFVPLGIWKLWDLICLLNIKIVIGV